MGYDFDDEIPMPVLQEIILKGNNAEAELLSMFCGVDNFDNKEEGEKPVKVKERTIFDDEDI